MNELPRKKQDMPIRFPVKSTILHADWEIIFAELTKDERCILLRDIFEFMYSGTVPHYGSAHMRIAWEAIYNRMVYDIRQYQKAKIKRLLGIQ